MKASKRKKSKDGGGYASDDSLSYWEEKGMRDINQKAEIFDRKKGRANDRQEGESLITTQDNDDECWTFEGDFAIQEGKHYRKMQKKNPQPYYDRVGERDREQRQRETPHVENGKPDLVAVIPSSRL